MHCLTSFIYLVIRIFDLMNEIRFLNSVINTKYHILDNRIWIELSMISFGMNKHVINTFKYLMIKFGSTSMRILVVICFMGEGGGGR